MPARWPFDGAMALASAEGNPLYFLPFFLTAPRATRFCSFSYARSRSISSPPLAALRARRFSCTMSNSCLNSKDERRERTATNSSVTKRSEEHTSELQSPDHLVCRLLLEKK